MYDAVRRLAEKKPVVAVCGTLATSAAYIVALATDRIFVYGNTITGSVGVIFQWAEVTDLLAHARHQGRGGEERPVEGGAEPVRADRREGARARPRRWCRRPRSGSSISSPSAAASTPTSVPGLTDGRIYSGRQAVELKLVDQIGDEKAAMDWLDQGTQRPSGLKIVDWKPEEESSGLFGWFFKSMAASIGLSAERIADIAGQISATLKLDGLVSVWHPASN